MSTKKLQILGQFGNKIYVQDNEPVNAPDGAVWFDLDDNVVDGFEGSTGTNIVIDSELNNTSTNPVQNKVIKTALDEKQDKDFIVIATIDSGNNTQFNVDKSYAEILTAYSDGKHVKVYSADLGLFADMDAPVQEGIITFTVSSNVPNDGQYVSSYAIQESNPNIGIVYSDNMLPSQDMMFAYMENYVPIVRAINNKTLTTNITLTASDVGADKAGTAAKWAHVFSEGALRWNGLIESRYNFQLGTVDDTTNIFAVNITDSVQDLLLYMAETASTSLPAYLETTVNDVKNVTEIELTYDSEIQGFTYNSDDNVSIYILLHGLTIGDISAPKGVYFTTALTSIGSLTYPSAYVSGFKIGNYSYPSSTLPNDLLVAKNTGSDTLTFNGEIDGRVSDSNGFYYKIHDSVPTQSEFANGGTIGLFTTNNNVSKINFEFNSNNIHAVNENVLFHDEYTVYIALQDNVQANGITFPEKGTYFAYLNNDDGITFVSSFTINGYDGFPSLNEKKINDKYLTTDFSVSEVLPEVTTTDNGKFLRVVNGAWTACTVLNAEEGTF